MSSMDYKSLAEKAVAAKEKAYAPYSNFKVGASLLTDDDKIFIGANIENASYGLTICAERTAAFQAVLSGEKKFKAIAIAGSMADFTPPCGSCRQVLAELCGTDIDVIMVNGNSELKIMKLGELLPLTFEKDFKNR